MPNQLNVEFKYYSWSTWIGLAWLGLTLACSCNCIKIFCWPISVFIVAHKNVSILIYILSVRDIIKSMQCYFVCARSDS